MFWILIKFINQNQTKPKMKTWVHFLVSAILAILLYPAFDWKALFIIAGGVLIDIDHYLWHIYKYKNFNLFEVYRFFIKNIEINDYGNVIGILLIFHTIEFLLVMAFLSFYFKSVFAFTIGLSSHYLLDLIFLCFVAKRVIVNHSIVNWILKNLIQKV